MMRKLLLGLATTAIGLGLALATASKKNVGTQLPELDLTYLGTPPELKGKPLLLEFWATWCGPCRASIPHLNELYRKYHGKGLETVGVTKDDEITIKAFLKDVPIEYPIGIDASGTVSSSFGIRGIPHAMLVDRSGKIVWEGSPTALTDQQLGDLVK